MQTQISKLLLDCDAVKFGEFIGSSGRKLPYYVDLRLIPSYSGIFHKIVDSYIELIEKDKIVFDRIAGVPIGALPFASAVAYKMKKPLLILRKEPKVHGRGRQLEGILNKGEKVLIIEDLVTTGGSVVKTKKVLEDEGAVISDVVVILDRLECGNENLKNHGLKLHAVTDSLNLISELKKENLISDENYNKIFEYISDFQKNK
ncbi:orotate phosphoribosyltransferase [Candidatus Altiarchaeales archaeon WOR_SM1_SCG]|nr:orotate phosphoribosyltransferase [Candidatus Altiarchaeales archaeon WOR_SM1_SCG]